MKYFKGITSLEQAKERYIKLSKKLHPDTGGTDIEFQNMQQEYETLLLQLKQKLKKNKNTDQTPEKELLRELGKIVKVLIDKKIPQNYLQKKIEVTESPLKKDLFSDIVNFLDGL